MIRICVFDANGNLINIGPWDYQVQPFEVEPEERDEEGNITKEAVYEDRVMNPLPDGAYEEEREIVQDADGGLVPAEDYQRLRKTAYPPIGDQLDAIWKHFEPVEGTEAAAMKEAILAVKAAYPKPEVDSE